MVIQNKAELGRLPTLGKRVPSFQRVLMVPPDFFSVQYAINPHMVDANGELNQIDKKQAKEQWQTLKAKYEDVGFQVELIRPEPNFPDMVFTANQSFPFWDFKNDSPAVVLSHMATAERRGEVPYFRRWYEEQDYRVIQPPSHFFEGNGDVIFDPANGIIWGGFGFRTEAQVFSSLYESTGLPILLLNLIEPAWYHLDTCFSILSKDCVAVLSSAFSQESLELIHTIYDDVIEISEEENKKYFTGNCHCPNGRDVILQSGSDEFVAKLRKRGFNVYEQHTEEFMKSGGSVFCLKMMVW